MLIARPTPLPCLSGPGQPRPIRRHTDVQIAQRQSDLVLVLNSRPNVPKRLPREA